MKLKIFQRFDSDVLERKFQNEQIEFAYMGIREYTLFIGAVALIRGFTYLLNPLEEFTTRFKIFLMFIVIVFIKFLINLRIKVLQKRGKKEDPILISGFYCCLMLFFSVKVASKNSNDYARAFTHTITVVLALYQSLYILRSFRRALIQYVYLAIVYFSLTSHNTWSLFQECSFKFLVFCSVSLMFIYRNEKELRNNFQLRFENKKQKTMYQQFLQALHDPVLIFSRIEGTLFQNNALIESVGDCYGATFYENICPVTSTDGRSLLEFIDQLSYGNDNSQLLDKEFTHNSKLIPNSTKTFSVSLISAGFFQQKNTVAVLMKDITAKMELEKAKMAESFKNSMLCTFSHELRTPLNGIVGMLQILRKESSDPSCTKYIDIALASSNFLHCKISDILDYSELEQGTFRLHQDLFSLKEILSNIEQMCLPQISDKKMELQIEKSPLLQNKIFGDAERVTQILINLLFHSIRSTNKGVIKLQVTGNEENIEITVEDKGRGMSSRTLENLFQMRVENYNKEQDEKAGNLAGLGLTVSQLICKKMDTIINVKSSKHTGTKFCLILSGVIPEKAPFSPSALAIREFKAKKSFTSISPNFLFLRPLPPQNQHQNHPQNSSSPSKQQENSKEQENPKNDQENSKSEPNYHQTQQTLQIPENLENPHCLNTLPDMHLSKPCERHCIVADDNEINRYVLRRLLMQSYPEIKIHEAENGEEAIRIVESFQVMKERGEDLIQNKKILIFMDLDMPVMDGIQATRKIRSFYSQRRFRIVVVAVTAHTTENERKKCYAAGMDAFYTKPINIQKVNKIITLFDK
jgi:signal transduction histidine kinase/CheY-like chemotaxis protein